MISFFLTAGTAFNLYGFLAAAGSAYLILDNFKERQQLEASGNLETPNKALFRAINILAIAFCLLNPNLIPSFALRIFSFAIYLGHTAFISRFDSKSDQLAYSSYLKKFWSFFTTGLFVALIALSLKGVLLGAIFIPGWVLAAGLSVPSVIYLLKKIISPHTRIGKIFYQLDTFLKKWASLLSLLALPSNMFWGLITHLLVAYSVYRPLIDNINYFLTTTISLKMLAPLNSFCRSKYIPKFMSFITTWYNKGWGKYYDELKAYKDYIQNKNTPMSYQEFKAIVNQNNTAELAPAVENLYFKRASDAVLESITIEEATDKIEQSMQFVLSSKQNLNNFLFALANGTETTYWKQFEDITTEDEAYEQIINYISKNPGQMNEDAQTGNNVAIFAQQLLKYFDGLKKLVQNTSTQLGANNEKCAVISQGIFALCDKYLILNKEVEQLEDSQESLRKERCSYANNILANLIVKSQLCQNGLLGFINEEIKQIEETHPLKKSWAEYMSSVILSVEKRSQQVYLDEITSDLTNEIQIEVRKALAKSLMFDTQHVDNSDLISLSYLPGNDEKDSVNSLGAFIGMRHMGLSLNRFVFPASVKHHLAYPALFSAQSVEEMIERTQQIYATAVINPDAPVPVKQWAEKCEFEWAKYLEQAYDHQYETVSVSIEQHDSRVLRMAYEELAQPYQAMYDTDIPTDIRARIKKRAAYSMGQNALLFLKEKIKEANLLPSDFDTWSQWQQREYLHLNNAFVRAGQLESELISQEKTVVDSQVCFVSREFATVILLSQGFLTKRQPLHEKLGEIGTASFCSHYTKEQLLARGYTKLVL